LLQALTVLGFAGGHSAQDVSALGFLFAVGEQSVDDSRLHLALPCLKQAL
jgi:hypothetical protein